MILHASEKARVLSTSVAHKGTSCAWCSTHKIGLQHFITRIACNRSVGSRWIFVHSGIEVEPTNKRKFGWFTQILTDIQYLNITHEWFLPNICLRYWDTLEWNSTYWYRMQQLFWQWVNSIEEALGWNCRRHRGSWTTLKMMEKQCFWVGHKGVLVD